MTTQRITIPIYDLGRGSGGALIIERAAIRVPGVIAAYVNPALEMAYITFDPIRCTPDQVREVVAGCGYRTGPVHAQADDRVSPPADSYPAAATADDTRLAARLKLAELTGSLGVGVLGAGLALLLPAAVAAYAIPILVLGMVMHGWGMLDKHRLETLGGSRPIWAEVLYWVCWITLAGLAIAVGAELF